MSLFRKEKETFTFFDGEGNKVERDTEVRFDPLTSTTARIIFDPGITFTAPDYTEAAKLTGGEKCPFCPENVLKMTPLFPKDLVEKGRIIQGEAVVAPNLFPYSKYNGVTIMSDNHYVKLEEFTETVLKNSFEASQAYINKVSEQDSAPLAKSINWNYLPHSGGSIIHPHLHVIVSETETSYQRNFSKYNAQFIKTYNKPYLDYLYDVEKEKEERWIGEKGNIAWLHAYAPKSHNDFIAIFNNLQAIKDITEQDWIDFIEGLRAIFKTLIDQGLASFNMILTETEGDSPVHVRLIPRLVLSQLGTSDINFFQSIHEESLIFKQPEKIAAKARAYF